MAHNQHHHQNHQAVDSLVNVFKRANHDLQMVQYKLEKEFQQLYPNNANPLKLVSRIKKIQEELPTLKDQCRELLAAKQNSRSYSLLDELTEFVLMPSTEDLIDKACTTLVGNRSLVQRMQAPLNVPVTTEAEDPGFANFNQVIDEWTAQVRSKTGDQEHDSDSEDINKLLFSAIVQSN